MPEETRGPSPPAGPSPSLRTAPGSRPLAADWSIAFVLALVLYAATSNRGIQWQDSGIRILRVLTQDVVGSLGLALSHPLHYWLGRIAVLPGWDNPAWAITLLSSLFGAVTVANVFGLVRTLTGRWQAAAFATASLAVAHIFWQMATLAESYTLVAALLTAEIWCLVEFVRGRRWCLPAMFLLNGLGLANHMLASLTTPVLMVVAIVAWRDGRVRVRDLSLAAALWLVGSLPYSVLVVAHWIHTGDLAGTLRSALFGRGYADRVLNTSISPGMLARSTAFLVYDFPNLLLPAAAIGLVRAGRLGIPRQARLAILAATIIHAMFVVRYNIVDQQTFFLPLCVLLSVWGGIGAAWVAAFSAAPVRRAATIAAIALLATTPVVYAVAPSVARYYQILDRYPQRPCRDNYVYFFVPWSVVETSAEQMSREAIDLARPDGLILYEDGMAQPALEYQRRVGAETTITVASFPRLESPAGRQRLLDLIATVGPGKPVVFVPRDVRKIEFDILPGMKWAPRGNLYVLERTAATTSAE